MHSSLSKIIEFNEDVIERDLPESRIISLLKSISSKDWFDAIKLGTEVESNDFDQIKLVREIFKDKIIKLKIGGAGAKNDIKKAFELNLNGLILPMAETAYAVENFLNNYFYFNNKFNKKMFLAMNLETITTVENLIEIKKFFEYFSAVTIGRSDLSASMHVNVDSDEVDNVIQKIFKFFEDEKISLKISIGGKITPNSSYKLYEKYKSDFINTKYVYVKRTENISFNVNEALIFEILLYKLFYKKELVTKEDYKLFVENNIKRIHA